MRKANIYDFEITFGQSVHYLLEAVQKLGITWYLNDKSNFLGIAQRERERERERERAVKRIMMSSSWRLKSVSSSSSY